MRKVILISSHCEDEEKVNVLEKNLIKLNKIGIDIILYSTVTLKEEITKLCTHYFYTKENPILCYPTKGIGTWRKFNINDEWITVTHVENDYGWAGAYQYKKLLEIAKVFQYDFFYLMIYDLILDEELINFFQENEKTLFFPSKHKGNQKHWTVGSHLISLTLEDSNKFIDEINLDAYLSNLKYILENFIRDICIKHNWDISEKIIEDEINRYTDPFFKNQTKSGIQFYYINDNINKNFFIIFFHVSKLSQIVIEVNEEIRNIELDKDSIIKIEQVKDKFFIKIDDEEFDLSNQIKNFSHSKLN
jgi:hypothetical protein